MQEIFDNEKAAKYLIVGWIKGWGLGTYIRALTGEVVLSEEIILGLAEKYKFLPLNVFMYKKDKWKGTDIRVFVRSADKRLSDALFDAATDGDRLKLHKRVAAIIPDGTIGSITDIDRRAMHKDRKRYLRDRTYAGMKKEERLKSQGGSHAWNVVK